MGNEKVSFGSLGRLFGHLLFCGLVAMIIWGILALVGMPISQDIARVIGLIVGWQLFPLVFKSKAVSPSSENAEIKPL
jgi:hypothetical protein